MLNQLTEFADAVNGAACKIFTDYGEAVTALQTVALVAPPARPLAIGLSLAQMAAKQNCEWDTEQQGPTNPVKGGCWKLKDGGGVVSGRDVDGNYAGLVSGNCARPNEQFTEIVSAAVVEGSFDVRVKTLNGETVNVYPRTGMASVFLEPCAGASCDDENDPTPPPPPPAPYIHTTEEGCELTVNFQGWGQLPDGSASGVFLIEPAPGGRASGGVIGGCNFSPTIVYNPGGGGGSGGGGGGDGGGDGGGPYIVPYPGPGEDDEGKPLWQSLLEAAVAGAAAGLVISALDELKECACPENPVQEGDYRTISFRSDETSPYGKSRLRKRFKYRSQSGLDLGAVVDHWQDFSFISGPVCVKHRGSALGSPQVWAASIDEGKRVIRHAGGEAGIDPDQVGKWRVGGSDNSRYGVSDTMRVDTTGGYYWITARDGSDARPIVARV